MMEPASGVDKLSLADTTRLDLTDDTDLLKDISDTSERQVFIHDPTLQPNEFNRATNHPNSLSLLPASSDFARLVPANHQAKIAFHEIATLVKLDNCWNPHCREAEVREIYTGYFRLNLDILPENFPKGWVIGSGRGESGYAGVDFLITADRERDRVGGRHGKIRHHKVSRVLTIVPMFGHGVLLNGEEISREGKVLGNMQMGLTIGNLTFKIEFQSVDPASYNAKLDNIVLGSGTWFSEKIESFDPTPTNSHLMFHGYQIQTPQAFGAYGVVSACVHTDSGNVYAVKRVQRTRYTFDQIRDEITVLKLLGKHPHICTLADVIYSDGDDTSMGNKKINDIYMFFEPWAPDILEVLTKPQVSRSVRWRAFHQGAQGIRYLHSLGIIHRDLKMGNILVVRSDPLRVVIADFGHATTCTNSQDHMKGTIVFLAPEIIELKRRSRDTNPFSPDPTLHWSCKSDVYSYGLVGWTLLHGKPNLPLNGIDKVAHQHLLATLGKSSTAAGDVLARMLAWDAESRLGMRELLLASCWSESETTCHEKKRQFPES
ncbi:uncharacterized protein PV06_07118 [Exophiala oligosperma]|uniref:Protein kinase domain-containing protein n=1 Tax=Exophiala oligosperma TaxID=215243 RepID=A0A0D2E1A8_9EURO|nr:uncharacterized protein PV06_07118 [Exophiala oligosperma]KIW41569.1 hypothetical protein PV06_07118 [Exophiala oligosperma]